MANFIAEKYPDFGDPFLTLEQIDAIEALRAVSDIIDPYDSFHPGEKIPRHLKKFAGLSRQCMQMYLSHHLECLSGTRNSCICLCHAENRTINEAELLGEVACVCYCNSTGIVQLDPSGVLRENCACICHAR